MHFPAAQGPVFVQDAQKGFLSSGNCNKNQPQKSQKVYKMNNPKERLCKMTRKKLHNAKNDLCNLTRAEASDLGKSIGKLYKNYHQNARSTWWSFGQVCGGWCPDCADRTKKIRSQLVKNLLRNRSGSGCADCQYQRKNCTIIMAGLSDRLCRSCYIIFTIPVISF